MSLDTRSLELTLEPGHSVLLTGPAQFRLLRGIADQFGAIIKPKIWTQIEAPRQIPIQAHNSCHLEVILGQGGKSRIVNESTTPPSWVEAAQIIQGQQGITIIVGPVDSGKSSLCEFLVNLCVQRGFTVGILDADVGQADIGPPCTVSCAHTSIPISSLQELRSDFTFFVGDTSPSSIPDRVIRAVVNLAERLSSSTDLVLVNTDGWIGEPRATRFKEELIHKTQPSLVLGLGMSQETDSLLAILPFASLRLPSSTYVRVRSKEERKRAREEGYRRILQGSSIVKIVQEVTTLRSFDRPEQAILRWDRKFAGLLAGLLDGDERLLGIGRISAMMDGACMVETITKVEPRILEIGNVMLSSNFEEIGYLNLH